MALVAHGIFAAAAGAGIEVVDALSRGCDLDEFGEDAEFEFEFDAVDHTLECDFDLIHTEVFDGEETCIEDDDGDVDGDELPHEFSEASIVDDFEDAPHLDQVYH